MKRSGYHSLTVDVPEDRAELLEEALHRAGALGLEIRDREAPPMPGVPSPAAGEATVVAFFDSVRLARAAKREVEAGFSEARSSIAEVPDQDWSNGWKALIRPTRVGRFWVGPPWSQPDSKELVSIVIEPKMAFGTGDHPTTQLCLMAVDRYLTSRRGASVLDVGCGTGVLAIAASKSGAGRVVGVDNDPLSVELAKQNAFDNGEPRIEISGADLSSVDGRFDLVLANILANTLIELAPAIAAKVGDQLVLAGLLKSQCDEVLRAYLDLGLICSGQAAIGDWSRLDLTRPS